ncbi:DUF3040 domain-containing protein [Micromonospora ureilytica]|nr:DUF3040 domain-containing protein [Micromonospora ureilytica]
MTEVITPALAGAPIRRCRGEPGRTAPGGGHGTLASTQRQRHGVSALNDISGVRANFLFSATTAISHPAGSVRRGHRRCARTGRPRPPAEQVLRLRFPARRVPAALAWDRAARAGDPTGRTRMATNQSSRAATRRRRQLWAGVLALVGLVLLIIGVTVADGVAAWVEVVVAILLLVTSYIVQHLARRETVYRHDERR